MPDSNSPVGRSFLTPEERDVIRGIRARGGAVVIFSPEELGGCTRKACEDFMIMQGFSYIEYGVAADEVEDSKEEERICASSEEKKTESPPGDDICPECSARMKTVMVPDNVGHGLHEELVCPDCEGEDDE